MQEKDLSLFSEPLYPYILPNNVEIELVKSAPLRRLKHLAHFGAGSFITPVVHSRYEHTVGVWKLTALYFPDDIELRIAALLHDIGHLPFSHAVEDTLNFNHHQLTEQYILEDEISSILKRYNVDPHRIIETLNGPSVITGIENILGIDHLDSFLRDTYMAGKIDILPKQLLSKIRCTSRGIETDLETGHYLLQMILADHKLFFSPLLVGVDRLLAEAIKCHWGTETVNNREFVRLVDTDVVSMLKSSSSKEARMLIDTLLYKPYKIRINKSIMGQGYPISVRKVYGKVPLYKGNPLTEHSDEAKGILVDLRNLSFDYEVLIAAN